MIKNHINGFQHLGVPVRDIEKTSDWLIRNLDFAMTAQFKVGDIPIWFVQSGNLVIELYQFAPGLEYEEILKRTTGHFDHFALDAKDIDRALAECQSKNLTLETDQGNCFEIPQCWENGARYFNIIGIDGERIEISHRVGHVANREKNVEGWAHLGLPVTHIDASEAFYSGLGFKNVMTCTIPNDNPDDVIFITMMENNGFIIELYQLPKSNLEEIRNRKNGQIDHVSLAVDDIQSTFEDALQAGYAILSDGIETLPIWDNGCSYFIIAGPDNERVEFNQIH